MLQLHRTSPDLFLADLAALPRPHRRCYKRRRLLGERSDVTEAACGLARGEPAQSLLEQCTVLFISCCHR